ncbi:MAG: GNAT family N-acetyltransferase [Anaerolineaceae bacterium]|nr:GNAT family N-acetyltransferase [Anaerolineaceae bacterium]
MNKKITEIKIRSASKEDIQAFSDLKRFEKNIHQHLDWRRPEEWLGTDPFLVLESHGWIIAALASPQDPPGMAWIRLFMSVPSLNPKITWETLFPRLLESFNPKAMPIIASIALKYWYAEMLIKQGFQHHQDIIVLEFKRKVQDFTPIPSNVHIRSMTPYDLKEVLEINKQGFDILWQNSWEGLKAAYKQSSYATVLEIEKKIVGYQISTSTNNNAHLARLAVLSEHKRKGLGCQLVQNMLNHYHRRGIQNISVNTQKDNLASIALYEKIGFELNGEKFPVLVYQLDNLIK